MNPRAAGFTLLEILVALVVLGFLMVGLSEGVRFGLRAWDSETRLVATHADMDAFERVLRDLVAQIDPGDPNNAPDPAADIATFKGAAHAVTFATRLPMTAPGPTRDAKVGLGADQLHRLVLRWTPNPHVIRIGPAPSANETVLLEGVDHIDLRYQRWPDQGGGWVSVWALPKPPLVIAIKVAFVKDDARHWPEIVVAPMRSQPDQ